MATVRDTIKGSIAELNAPQKQPQDATETAADATDAEAPEGGAGAPPPHTAPEPTEAPEQPATRFTHFIQPWQ